MSRLTIAATVLAAITAGCAKAPPRSASAPSARQARREARAEQELQRLKAQQLQREAFEHAWKRIADTYPYADFRGVDWQAVHDELLPRAERCRDAADLRPVLTEMLSRLNESHFQVLPGRAPVAVPTSCDATPVPASDDDAEEPESLRGDVGLEVRRVGEEIVVLRVAEGSPAARAGIAPGWTLWAAGDVHARDVLRRVASHDARSVASHDAPGIAAPDASGVASRDARAGDYLAWAVMNAALRGPAGTTLRLVVQPPGEPQREIDLVRAELGTAASLGTLEDLVVDFDARTLPGDVGYVRFNMFLAPVAQPFSEAMRGFVRDRAKGVVIDLRGNPGGIGGLVMGMAGHFVRSQGTSLGHMKTREASLDFIVNPRGPGAIYDGPVAILVDSLSLSTAELFAAGLQQLGRARVFGQPTGGMALPSIVESLPNGDKLQFAVADLTAPGGRRIEGVGVQPDAVVPLRVEDLRAGRDAVLEAATTWIESAPTRSGT